MQVTVTKNDYQPPKYTFSEAKVKTGMFKCESGVHSHLIFIFPSCSCADSRETFIVVNKTNNVVYVTNKNVYGVEPNFVPTSDTLILQN